MMSVRRRSLLFPMLLLILALLFAACGGQEESTPTMEPTEAPAVIEQEQDEEEAAEETEAKPPEEESVEAVEEKMVVANAVTVEDQELSSDNTVTIGEIIADVDGWMVIHAQADGKPGPILGVAPVKAGENTAVIVKIDPAAATEIVYAMLHVDAGVAGEFEFPGGEDGPATDAAGNVVTPPFNITGGLPVAVNLLLAESGEQGPYLTDEAGMTLYTFARDVPGTSNCYDRCAVAWPPLLVEEGDQLVAGEGLPGELGTTEREDGTLMVTYNNWPLYYWVNDGAPGDTTGHNVGNVWAVAYPTTHVFLGGNEELGSFLVGPDGLTLYRFNPDEPGVSNCTDQCALNWPPLLIEDGEIPRGNAGVVGELGTTDRDDGTTQVTYEGMPLYYWLKDEAPGDATGQNVNDVWFVVAPYTVRLGNNEALGDFLIGANSMTLYLFTNDEAGLSNCYDQCATNWPPLLVQAGEVPVPGEGVTGKLETIERADGAFQVTYNGQPLYFWAKDEAPGDTTGHEVGDVWFVVPPSHTVRVDGNEELGDFLVAANGLTLYLFTNDVHGVSNCYEQCATNWPPLLVQAGETPLPGRGVTGLLDTTERDDGTFQVTYNGQPLYYWVNDEAPGDTTGHEVGDVWFVVPPSHTVRLGSNEELGDFLIAANGMTLYLFTNDDPEISNCYDQCATNWPPLLVQEGETPLPSQGVTGDLATTERDDGTLQVTYNGLPLYFWAKDKAPGDTTGHEVGDVWFVVPPEG